jgi:hypothetical protein
MRELKLKPIPTKGKSPEQIAAAVAKAPSFQEQMRKLHPNPEPGEYALVDGELYMWHPSVEVVGDLTTDQPERVGRWVQPTFTVPG